MGGMARHCCSGMGLSAASNSSRVPVGPEVGESVDERSHMAAKQRGKEEGRACASAGPELGQGRAR